MAKRAGVYWIRGVFGGIAYVGQTSNWPQRRTQHEYSHDVGLSERLGLARWGFRSVSSEKGRIRLEKEMIAKYDPPLNKNAGGATGRPRK